MTTILQLLKSRTVLFALLLAVLSVAQGYIGLFILDQKQQALVGMGIAGAVAVLSIIEINSRLLTQHMPTKYEWTFSTRCKRLQYYPGWRGGFARLVRDYTNFFDPQGDHIKFKGNNE